MKHSTDLAENNNPDPQTPVQLGAMRPYRQRLTPLFVLAGVVMVVGYYLAITQHQDPDEARAAADTIATHAPLEIPESAVDIAAGPVALRHAPAAPHALKLTLAQSSQIQQADQANASLRTELTLDFEEAVAPQKDRPSGMLKDDGSDDAAQFPADALAVTHQYTGIRGAVFADEDKTIGAGITTQVADLLKGSITRRFIRPNGEPAGFEWVEVPNPQARRTLYLVRDAQAFLTPRFMAGAVNPGDTWSYQRPLWVDDAAADIKAEGTVTIDNRFVGMVTARDARQLALIRQNLQGNASGNLDQAETQATFSMEGTGQGVFLVDVDAGSVVAGDVDFERTLTIDDGETPVVQTSKISLSLRPATGVELRAERDDTPDPSRPLEASN